MVAWGGTSHIAQNNLTILFFMHHFTRLSLGFSKKLENLAAATSLHVTYFNFCWEMRQNEGPGKRSAPAVAEGVIPDVWTVADLYWAVWHRRRISLDNSSRMTDTWVNAIARRDTRPNGPLQNTAQ